MGEKIKRKKKFKKKKKRGRKEIEGKVVKTERG